MSSSARRWASLALCLAGACVEKTPMAPGAEVVAVHAVLNPAERVQHVAVMRTSGGTGGGIPVRGATVSLVTPNGIMLPATEVSGPYDYLDRFPVPGVQYDVATDQVEVGRLYRLRVVLPDGRVVEGETTPPAVTPATVASERRLNRNVDTLRLSWPRVPGARAYEVRISAKRDSLYPYGEYVTFADTSLTLAGTARRRQAPIFIEGLRYDLVVSAVDANYYAYYAFDSDQYTGTALPTSLRGAEGVFGALVPIVRMSITVEGVDPRVR
jgi:hypothetical protein